MKKLEMTEMEDLQGGWVDCLAAVMSSLDAWAVFGKNPTVWNSIKWQVASYQAFAAC